MFASRYSLATILTLAFLASCGGDSSSPDVVTQVPAPTAPPPVAATEPETPNKLPTVNYKFTPLLQGKEIQTSNVSDAFINATGSISHPQANQSISGNFIASIRAEDPDGIDEVYLGFANTEFAIPLCQGGCGSSLLITETGINPLEFEQESGNLLLELFVKDGQGNESRVATRSFTWQRVFVEGVTAQWQNQNIQVSWQSIPGYFRYNLYIAYDSELNPKNISTLDGGQAFRSLTSTSFTIANRQTNRVNYIRITAIDGSGESAFSEPLTLIPAEDFENQPPVATNDEFSLDEDSLLEGNLLANDQDPEAGVLTINQTPLTAPQKGSININANGDFSYTPQPNINGEDSFVYQITDNEGATDTAAVILNILPVNDSPIALDDEYSVTEAITFSPAPGETLLANDSDIDGDSLSVDSTPVTPPQFGSLTLNADGSFTYQSQQGLSETLDQFQYRVTDPQGASATATVTLNISTVNEPPSAQPDTYTIDEDNVLNVNAAEGILANDSDPDGEPLVIQQPLLSTTTNGELVVAPSGAFDYSPSPNFNGVDSFSYKLVDSAQQESSATVTLTINAVNDAPIAVADEYQATTAVTLEVTSTEGLLNNDTDIDGDNLTVLAVNATPTNGSVTLSADGSFSYTSNNEFLGTDTFSYDVSDNNGGTATGSVSIIVAAPVNTQPVAVDDVAEVQQGSSVIIDVLANDTDADEDPLTITDATAGNGTVIIEENQVVYTPTPEFFGTDTIDYSISDGNEGTASAQVVVTVTENNAPVANPDTAETLEDESVEIDVLANDTDPLNGTLSVTAASATNGSISISNNLLNYTPNLNFNGTDTINYTLESSSGNNAEGLVTVTVISVNDPPVTGLDFATTQPETAITVSVLDNDSDPEGDPLTVILAATEFGETIINNGTTVTYTPVAGIGSDIVTYQVSDGNGGITRGSIIVTITEP